MKALKGFSSDRRLEEGGSDSGVLKIVWQLPVSPYNPSGPWKHHLENVFLLPHQSIPPPRDSFEIFIL